MKRQPAKLRLVRFVSLLLALLLSAVIFYAALIVFLMVLVEQARR